MKTYMRGELVFMTKKEVVNICSKVLPGTRKELEKYSKDILINKYLKERNKAILKG